MPVIEMVVAVAENGIIGKGGDMPWRLPSDLKHFKQVTMGCPIIMGRLTWESIGRPFARSGEYCHQPQRVDLPDGVVGVATPEEALDAAGDAETVMIIGGGQIYKLFEPQAATIHLTEVHAEPDAATRHLLCRKQMRGKKFPAKDFRLAKMTAPIIVLSR